MFAKKWGVIMNVILLTILLYKFINTCFITAAVDNTMFLHFSFLSFPRKIVGVGLSDCPTSM